MKRFLSVCGAVSALLAVNTNAEDHLDALMPVRGFCIAAPRPVDLDGFIAFIDAELAPRHVNTLILRVDYDYQFQSRPEMADKGGLSREDTKKLVAVCKKDNIHLVPLIDLLGHQSYGSNLGALLRVHPEFDETPQVKMPEHYEWPNPDKLYCKSYCPLHPKVHEVLFALIDELCDDFEADAFHAGMDEVFYIGESNCPRCAGKDKAQLFAGEVWAIRDHLREKGRSLWIWGDRLLDGNSTGMGEWEASQNGTSRAIDLVPKDVILCDWHYERPDPTPAYFAIKGFKVVSCPWKSSAPAIQQADDMARWRKTVPLEMKDRFQGVVQTVWTSAAAFLDRDYKGDSTQTNSWNCFKAMFDEIAKLDAANPGGNQQ
jgi:hypothetical protein